MQAVVLGAGMAGLCAAAALSAAGHHVVVVERDLLDDERAVRPGSPHGRQLHNLLGRAQLHLEELLPGFTRRLLAAGGVRADVSTQTHVYELGVRMPERPCGLSLLTAARPAIEQAARACLPSAVTVREGTRACGIEASSAGVASVLTETGRLGADLVIDAMGAGSPMLDWLSDTGLPTPPVTSYTVRQWYCSAVFRRPAAWRGKPDFWLTFPSYPKTRGGLISPLADDRWYVSLSGTVADPIPRTIADFLGYAESLEDPAVAQTLSEAEAISALSPFGRPRATWRRYELLDRPLAGLLPLGDAVATLNPLLGQGISVASWQAAMLAAVATGADVEGITRSYLARSASAAAAAWSLTRLFDPSDDLDMPRLAADDWMRIARVVRDDEAVHSSYVRIWHLLEPAATLTTMALREADL